MRALLMLSALLLPSLALAQSAGLPAFTSTPSGGGQTYTLSLQTLLLLTSLSFLPAALLMMTSFTRIIIVLSLLRHALGTQSSPPNQVMIGLALFLTLFVMGPTLDKIYTEAYQPLSENRIQMGEALDKGAVPLRAFMMKQTRETDLALFVKMSGTAAPKTAADVPMRVLIPAYITSELKTAFQIGFAVFIPFLIIDMVVASILMAMGMMMVSPSIVSLPFKIGLFVSVFQAATQIKDASLSFIPKVIAVLATFAIAGPWMLTVMTDYMRRVLTALPSLIGCPPAEIHDQPHRCPAQRLAEQLHLAPHPHIGPDHGGAGIRPQLGTPARQDRPGRIHRPDHRSHPAAHARCRTRLLARPVHPDPAVAHRHGDRLHHEHRVRRSQGGGRNRRPADGPGVCVFLRSAKRGPDDRDFPVLQSPGFAAVSRGQCASAAAGHSRRELQEPAYQSAAALDSRFL